jgi:replicative DNA helicase
MDDVGQAEYATLGSLLLAPAGLDGVAPWLAPGDFRDPLGREVYGLLLAMRARSAVIDVVRDDLADRDDPVTRVPPPQLVL